MLLETKQSFMENFPVFSVFGAQHPFQEEWSESSPLLQSQDIISVLQIPFSTFKFLSPPSNSFLHPAVLKLQCLDCAWPEKSPDLV